MSSVANMGVLRNVVEETVWDMPPCHWVIGSRCFKGTYYLHFQTSEGLRRKPANIFDTSILTSVFLGEFLLIIWKFDAVLLNTIVLSYYLLNLMCMTYQYLFLHPSWEIDCNPDKFLYSVILRVPDSIPFSSIGII